MTTRSPQGVRHLVPAMAAALASAVLVAGAVTASAETTGNGPTSPPVPSINEPDAIGFRPDLLERLTVPAGFKVGVFAKDAGNVRIIHTRPNGDVYVSRRLQGDLLLLSDRNRDGVADEQRVVASDIPLLHGITSRGSTMYLTANREVMTATIRADGSLGAVTPIVTDLPDAGQHSARTLEFGPDGYLYLGIGSTCNSCDEANRENATMVRMRPDGTGRTVFAKGLRHTIGFGWQPTTKALWGFDQGSDWRGDEQPPEELNGLARGGDYGWPWCFGKRVPDPFISGQPANETKATYCPRTKAPSLTYTAHAAAIAMRFYEGRQFPAAYRGDAFVAMRGSWNRAQPSGYKVVRVRFDPQGKPVGFEDFLTGFLIDPRTGAPANPAAPERPAQFGRVAGVGVMADGSLLVSDDQNGVIYRVSYGSTVQAALPADKPLPPTATSATSVLVDAMGTTIGSARVTREATGALRITADVAGLTRGVHGTHVHDRGQCARGPDPVTGQNIAFGAAGSHFDPARTRNHGRPDDPGTLAHAGDLPAITVAADGTGRMDFRTTDLTLDDGPTTIIGRTLVVHAQSDDYASEPAGGSGERIACGLLVAQPSAVRTRAPLAGANAFPEGIAYDPRSDLAYVGSSTTGDIYKLDPKSNTTSMFALGGSAGRTAALGLALDRHGRLLVAGGSSGSVAVLDTRDAGPLKVLDTGRGPQPFVNDLAVTPDDQVYVTDSKRPVIWRFRSGATVGPISPWLDLRRTPIRYGDGVNLNGIVASADGRYLLAVQTNTGQLWRISTATKAVTEVLLTTRLTGGDGLHLDGRTLYVVRNAAHSVVRLQMSADFSVGLSTGQVRDANLVYPTSLARRGSRLLVVDSQLDRQRKALPPILPFVVQGVDTTAFTG